ncbi:hypothetical protein CVT26_003256 [Gymnopilus dilepis]|uniref:BTB domain-containing protein n=1 Tax=Gymnopilus dilepis TaxID=231916 RepID=A0A409Y4W2_9AGAR|nr:hypothetical protein CVT26_003256 [Gymnopilus dilepis]
MPVKEREKIPPEKYTTLVRSDFWFRDGNIVIIAGSAAFKVHRGQLERHSEVFSDLFSLPQPDNPELVDGCPCVELQDSPSDVFYFLSALYDGLYFKKPRSSDFPAVAAVLRLSSKYLVEHLRQHCLARLTCDWPTRLVDWDTRERRCTDETGRYVPRDFCAHPILVIELALDMNLPAILPAALYDLSRYGPSKIMSGTTSPITAYERVVIRQTNSPLPPFEKPVRLSRELLCRTLRGREATQHYMARFIAKELHCRSPAVDCLNRTGEKGDNPSRSCHESFYFIMLNILRSVGGIACGRDADPLYTLIQAAEMLSRTDFSDGQRQCGLKLCQPCKADFAEATAKAREEVWSLLPQWFGFVESDKRDSLLDLD